MFINRPGLLSGYSMVATTDYAVTMLMSAFRTIQGPSLCPSPLPISALPIASQSPFPFLLYLTIHKLPSSPHQWSLQFQKFCADMVHSCKKVSKQNAL